MGRGVPCRIGIRRLGMCRKPPVSKCPIGGGFGCPINEKLSYFHKCDVDPFLQLSTVGGGLKIAHQLQGLHGSTPPFYRMEASGAYTTSVLNLFCPLPGP